MEIPSSLALHPDIRQHFLRWVRTPKGLLLILFVPLLLSAVPFAPSGIIINLLVAAAVAMIFDLVLARLALKTWIVPDSALLSGLIVAMVMGQQETPLIVGVTAALAICGKHLLRLAGRPIFNPAALALLVAALGFGSAESWWGGLAGAPVFMLPVLLVCGSVIIGKVNKFPQVLAFLGTYITIFTLAGFLVDPALVAAIFRAPFIHAALYFAFFMLVDPPTSPGKYAEQIIYGIMVALASFVAYFTISKLAFLLIGVLVGNLWVAWNRREKQRELAAARKHPALTQAEQTR